MIFCSPREGEEGDNFYVIDSGVYKALKGSGDSEKTLFTYDQKGAFGELALMYNCPRAATVVVSLEAPEKLCNGWSKYRICIVEFLCIAIVCGSLHCN